MEKAVPCCKLPRAVWNSGSQAVPAPERPHLKEQQILHSEHKAEAEGLVLSVHMAPPDAGHGKG